MWVDCGPFTHHQLASSGSLKLAAVWYVSDKVWTICRKNLIVTIPKVWRPVTLKSRNLWPVLGYSIPTGKHPPVSSIPQSDRFWRHGQRLGVTTEMINIPQLQVATGCFFHFTGIPTNKNEDVHGNPTASGWYGIPLRATQPYSSSIIGIIGHLWCLWNVMEKTSCFETISNVMEKKSS
jgi:hypothetical protein